MRRAIALLLAMAAAACVGGATRAPDPAVCASLFLTYDRVVRHYPDDFFDDDFQPILRSPLSRWIWRNGRRRIRS